MRHCHSYHRNQNQNQKHVTNMKWKPLRNLKGINRVVLQNMSQHNVCVRIQITSILDCGSLGWRHRF